MHNYGIILRKLRELNSLPLKKAAKLINRGVGWLSEIENNKGMARIQTSEFERIVSIYNGEQYRKRFPMWVASAHKTPPPLKKMDFSGPIMKYMRKKAKLSLVVAAEKTGYSKSYLSRLENGQSPITLELRNHFMKMYGYTSTSFSNFFLEERAKTIPARYKLDVLLKQAEPSQVEKILTLALNECSK